ncbi:MAG: tRNA (adenosine(37)-N6)-threonylcarbamoyltransferase complex transferase subunit TsaD [Heliobacteriaceae bacterium]|jgi:N6-L-threonylcarbamoyladenine synthase|nr:tRNA (adenosine(37)-N6)-threonylcarbamoyltransferase complex transferase subunit TsaD [Heliobacteriaceae bacterium]
MNILAIETSCDETACAVVKDGREVLADVVASQIKTHERYGGVIPEIAAREHLEAINVVIEEAFRLSGLAPHEIDAFAGTVGPGLVGCLLVGLNAAKTLSLVHNKPFIGVNHLEAHLCANYLDTDLKPPFMALLVSGGHTQIIDVKSYSEQEIIGETIDDAVGEAYDKVARLIGLPYPGGPVLDNLAQQGNLHAFKLPEAKVDGYNFSFSGLKTAVLRLVKSFENPITPIQIEAAGIPKFDKIADLKKWIVDNLSLIGDIIIKSNSRKVHFTKDSIGRSLKGVKKNEARKQSYNMLRELVETAKYSYTKNSDKKHSRRVTGQEIYHNALEFNGNIYGVEISVDIPKNPNAPHVYAGHKVRLIKMSSAANGLFHSNELLSDSPDDNISIAYIRKIFNPPDLKPDICASFQECVSSTLVKKLRGALEVSGYKQVVIAGGVAANSEIRRKVFALKDEAYEVFAPPMKYCTDNAAMVASCAYFNTNTYNDLNVEVFSRVK